MKKVAMLVFEECIAGCVAGTLDVFDKANDYLRGNEEPHGDKSPGFEVDLVSAGPATVRMKRVSVGPCKSFTRVRDADLIISNAVDCDPREFVHRHKKVATWIRDHYDDGRTEVASFCTGAFLLAETGLVDGRPCSTHWAATELLGTMYPAVDIKAHTVMTDQDRIYSSGGATSFYNLLLYIIEKYYGRGVALQLAKGFLIDLDRVSQSHFSIFTPQKHHKDEPIKEAQQFIEGNFNNTVNIDELSRHVGMSRRSFIRRFKDATHNTPIQYVQRVKMEAAKKALEATSDTVGEIMYQVGYNDMKFFRKLFRDTTGLTPAAYRDKYNHSQPGQP